MAHALSAHALAKAADVSQSWAWKARDAGIIHAPYTAEDVIALKVYAFVSQLVWPGEKRVRSEKHALELWQALAVHTACDAVSTPHITNETVLWVLPYAVFVATTPAERAKLELDTLPGRPCVRLPLGQWVEELPELLTRVPVVRPRRPFGADPT